MLLTRIGHGDLTAVARANVFIVFRPMPGMQEIDKELGVHLWHALGSERGIQKVVSILAQSGLENMPEFALVQPRNNSLHVIVRGSFNVLVLNHDGRYSSVGSDGMATWREYTSLPASEWCVRGTPGVTVDATEAFYLASGVSRISVMASLGWDDPDTPETAAEKKEIDGIPAHEIVPTSGATRHAAQPIELPSESKHSVAVHSHENVKPQSEIQLAPAYEGTGLAGAPTIAMPVLSDDQSSVDSDKNEIVALAREPENSSPRMTQYDALPSTTPQQESAHAQVPLPEAEPLSVPPTRVPASQYLQPISGQQVATEQPDSSNTMLTNNLVELRANMAQGGEIDEVEEAVTAVIGIPMPAIILSNGVRIPLDRTVLIGRAPEASRVPLRELPRLVNVASPNNDISRTHAQVRVEGEFVLVTDLNSTNGVFLASPGQTPQRLHPDEPTQLLPGTVVDLGDGATFELEVPQ